MKKIFLFLFASSVLASGCQDDDTSEALIGTWIGVSNTVSACTDEGSNSFMELDCTNISCFKLELNADGTYSYQKGAPVERGDWSKGSGLSLCREDDGEIICDLFAIDENTSATLVLSTTDEVTACKTAISFERELPADTTAGT